MCLLITLSWGTLQAQQNYSQRIADVDVGLGYNECFFIVSNFSCTNSFSHETASVPELLQRQTEGFYFYLKEDNRSKAIMLRKSDGTFIPLKGALDAIRLSLEANPHQFMTLFLDFNVNIGLVPVFEEAGLAPYLYIHGERTVWPALKEMMDEDKRLVVFEVQEHVGSPAWLHNMNEFVEHTDPDWSNARNSVEIQEDRVKKTLSMFNGFKNVEAMRLRGGTLYETARYTPYLVNLVRDTWSNEGRMPNFIVVDKYDTWVESTVRNLRNFNLVYGAVVSNNELVNYVNWEGMANSTPGIYCFPLENDMELMLSPIVPGYRVQPEKLYAKGNQKRIMMDMFQAIPIDIDESLEVFLPFNGDVDDHSLHKYPIGNQGVVDSFEMDHGQAASFDGHSRINLPTSQDLSLRDHDFTVQVWLKIPKYADDKNDYCVLGSKSSAYQQALHLLIRNGKPYMGFYNNDIEGNTQIEPNRWYNVTWRYNKQNGEQAIFVNGKLDAIATSRPGYMGSDSLYVGFTGFNQSSYFSGTLDNIAIWSRVLSEKEILGLSNQVIELRLSQRTSLWEGRGWTVAIVLAIILMSVLVFGHRRRRRHEIADDIRLEDGQTQMAVSEPNVTTNMPAEQPEKNYIRLFGPFEVIDKDGDDITALFTPKLKRLFILILVNSTRGKSGIKGSEMCDYIWGKDSKNAKSLRSVSVLKLRKILERLDHVEISFNVNKYAVVMNGSIYCDYLQCLAMLEKKQVKDRQTFERFFDIVKRGEAFEGESFDWLDDDKSFISNSAVDVMAHFISDYRVDEDADKVIDIARKMLVNDPCNEEALQYLTKAMLSRNNTKQAHYVYESFCAEYKKTYGEDFKMSFEEVASDIKVGEN